MKSTFLRSASLLALLTVAISANAALTQVGSRVALGANDAIDWGQFGPAYTSLANSVSGTTNLGLGFNLSSDSQMRLDEANGWGGNFAPGDRLVWNQGGGDLTITFAGLVSGAGFNIQRDQYGSFDGMVTAFDSMGVSLGSFNVLGNSDSANDGSAVFLGFLSSATDVKSIVIHENTTNDFAINEVGVVTSRMSSVPGPAAIAPFALGALSTLRKRRRKA